MRITPEVLRPRADRAVSNLDTIWKNWRWSRRLGFDRLQVTDEASVSTGAYSNPTQSIAVTQQAIRDLVKQGEKALVDAINSLERADFCFGEALSRADNRSPRVRESDLADQPWVSHRERRKLEQAQRRRAQSGEDVP
jgi:hypothetical protein